MDETYQMVGCLDFGTDSYAISIPVLRKPRSNYVYIPKTDHHFIVIDFYEIYDLAYKVHYLPETRPVSIGQKTLIPILDGGKAYVVDPDWTDTEVRTAYPQLSMEAVKAFLSLRLRMAQKPMEIAHGEIGADIEDLLVDPVRSRYWISKFEALVRSAYESGQPSHSLVKIMEDTRLKWLDKFSTKTSLKLVTKMMQVPNLTLQPIAAERVLLTRFEGIMATKGIFVPKGELIAYEKLFPNGIMQAIRADCDQYDYWRRAGQIGKMVNDQMFDLMNPLDSTQSRKDQPSRWSFGELDRILRFFRVLGSDDQLLDQAVRFFLPLYDIQLTMLSDVLDDRYMWTSALSGGKASKEFRRSLAAITPLVSMVRQPDAEQWFEIIGALIAEFRKLVLLAKIVWPRLRNSIDDHIAFKELDHALIDTLKRVYQTNNLSEISSLIQAGNTA